MRSKRKKFIISLLVFVMALLPVRTVLAAVTMDFSSNKTVEVMEIEKDVVNIAQYYISNNIGSDHCRLLGHDMQDSSMNDTYSQEDCDQCGISTLALFDNYSLQFTDGYIEHASFTHEGILRRLVIPPFRPPRA